MEKKISTTNTKAEILKAYDELLEKLKQSKQENPKVEQERKIKEETVKAATDLSDEKIINQISALKLTLNTTLDKIEDDLSSEYQRLKKIREAISIEDQRLKDLYGINAGADSLAAILAAQNEKKEAFEEELRSRELEREKEEKAWAEQRKELEEIEKKKRAREEEEYQYNLQLVRKKEKDQYEQKKALLEKELADKKASFESEIKEREQAVAAAEQELKELRTKAEKFPSELEKAVQAAVKETTAQLEKDYKIEKQLAGKEHESEIKLKNLQTESLQERIKDLELQLKQAFTKVESAETNTKEITLKAIQSSGQIRFIEKEETRKKSEE
ncbi:MAG: hypothetical protein JXB19_08175 [Bacteroidales bacterium]|nr:hypothetical protein [Bacteroidales bacterium]